MRNRELQQEINQQSNGSEIIDQSQKANIGCHIISAGCVAGLVIVMSVPDHIGLYGLWKNIQRLQIGG